MVPVIALNGGGVARICIAGEEGLQIGKVLALVLVPFELEVEHTHNRSLPPLICHCILLLYQHRLHHPFKDIYLHRIDLYIFTQ